MRSFEWKMFYMSKRGRLFFVVKKKEDNDQIRKIRNVTENNAPR